MKRNMKELRELGVEIRDQKKMRMRGKIGERK